MKELLSTLVAAAQGPEPALAVAAALERIAGDGEAIIAELGLPLNELVAWPLHRTPSLTVVAHVWPAGMRVPAHDHGMWSVVASLRGVQRQHVWKDQPEGPPEIHDLHAGQVLSLPPDRVHSVHNPGDEAGVTLHVYGGDLLGASRHAWDPVTGNQRPLEPWMLHRLQEAYHRVARAETKPIVGERMQAVLAELMAELARGPTVPRRTALGVAFDDRGSGAPIVFVHGLTFTRRTWDPIVERIAERHRCVTLDLPAHGETQVIGAIDLDAAVRSVESVIDELGLTRPLLVGHSAGAVIATVCAGRREVAGVLNVDQPLLVERFAAFLQSIRSELEGAGFAQTWDRFESSFGYDALSWRERARLLLHHRVEQATVLGAWSELLARTPAELRDQFRDVFARLEAPVLALHGSPTEPEYATWLARAFRSPTTVESWAGLGHFPHLAEAERFARRLSAFASQVQPA